MPCVTHLGLHQGPAGLRAEDSTAAAALHGKAHWRACVCAVPGSDVGAGGFVCMCCVNANPDKGRAGLGALQRVRQGGSKVCAVARRWREVLQLQGYAMGLDS